MNLSGIKLVVSDMDGTLLNPNSEVSNRFFKQFQELRQRNIHFVVASGRQYQSILNKLYDIQDELSIIAENGGLLKFNNEEKILFQLSLGDVRKTIELLRKINGCYIVLCGIKSAYIESKDSNFISKFSEYYAEYQLVEDLIQVVDDEFLKIAVYHFESSEDYVYPHIKSIAENLKIVVSGQNWLDISHPAVNKGYALNIIQNELGISSNETMVFGDYNNDLNMLQLGYYSFAMENAHQNVKNVARFTTKSNAEQGVEEVLDKLLATE